MKSLAHSRWECKSHVVVIPQYRRKAIYGEVRQLLGEIFHDLARQKACRIIEGHLLADHVHVTLAECQTVLREHGRTPVSVPTICRALQELELPRKKKSRRQ